ncbi:hypothetical protein [Flavobacterium sp. RS13.1]|uniref:hypothetical protein n=1 Tax=Flavobacterium sp. RS13.1 TaxID=3400345 RepID=UPI003AADB006
MKKIIGILGIAVLAAGMFFSANALNGSAKDVSLSDFTTLNKAHVFVPDKGIPKLTTEYLKMIQNKLK